MVREAVPVKRKAGKLKGNTFERGSSSYDGDDDDGDQRPVCGTDFDSFVVRELEVDRGTLLSHSDWWRTADEDDVDR